MGSQFSYHSFSASSASSINRNPLASTSSWFGLHTIFTFPFFICLLDYLTRRLV